MGTMRRDPQNPDFSALLDVAAEPQSLADMNEIMGMASVDAKIVGGFSTPVTRTVFPEETVNGSQQIVVRQCMEDAADVKGYQGGVEVDLGNPRQEFDWTVRWVEANSGWRVVQQTMVSDPC
jgi:hypothetical protein